MGVISLDLQQTDAGANKWSYNWLTDLPSINGVTIQGDLTLEDLDIIIPTKVSELENDAGYITEEDLTDRFYTKDEVYNKDEIDDKFDDIVIPTKVSELENDAGYITDAALTPYYTSAQVDSLVEAEAAQRLNTDTALGNRLTTAEGKIATNETDIANNAANISANTAGIATNAANIATNTANIATNTADIATNTADIATNASNIATNTANIATNTTNIAANTTAISNEATARQNADSGLSDRITANTTAISTNTANIATNTTDIATNAANIATNTANIATNASAIAQNTSDIATNAANIATNTANIATNTANIATNASDIAGETTAREIADQGLQEQIDAIAASSDVVDIVGTYAALQAYDTSKLHDNDIIKVLDDETRTDATTYYRWSTTTSTWSYIGSEGPFYTKADADTTFVPQTRTINSKALSSNITLTAQDVGALPDSTVIPTVNNATLTIQKNGTTVQTFTANSSTNKTANITVPTKTSDLTNDGDGTSDFATETYVDTYGGKIDVIKVNGTAQTITNKTVDISVPTKTSDIANDSGYITSASLPTKTSDLTNDGSDGTSTYVEADNLATVATSGSYNDLSNKPTIPDPKNYYWANVKVSDTSSSSTTPSFAKETFTGSTHPHIAGNSSLSLLTLSATGGWSNGSGTLCVTPQSIRPSTAENGVLDLGKSDAQWKDIYVGGSMYHGSYKLTLPSKTGTVALTSDIPGVFTGANASTAGTSGIVPAPAAGDNTKFLSGDGTWKTVSQYELPIASANTLGGVKIGENLSITNTGVLSADAQHIDVDSALSTTSKNPVQNKVITTKVNEIDRYYRSLVPVGTAVAANKNLNTTEFLKVGKYYCSADATVATLTNCPTDKAFMMEVFSPLSTTIDNETTGQWIYRVRILTTYTGLMYIQQASSGSTAGNFTYGAWSQFAYKSDIGNATLTIQKNGTNVQTFTANATSNKTANITVPTKTSDLTNDSNFVASGDLAAVATSGSYNDLSNKPTIPAAQVQSNWTQTTTTAVDYIKNKPTLATVATSGSYNDLSNKPTIPTVNNATLTIQKNGSTVKTFTANASSNVTANITVPTATSELTNDAGFIDEIPVASAGTLGGVKVGSNLSIDASGVLSADADSVWTANNLSPAANTPASWKTLLGGEGLYWTWYTVANKFTNQPATYGFLRTVIGGSDIRQDFYVQTGGEHYYRTGNGTGWYGQSSNAGVFRHLGNNIDSALSTTSSNPVKNSVVTNALNDKANSADLATVATSGSYNDLSNKPTIPTVNNATLTIQKNGTNVQTFTANSSSNKTANITVPTKTSDLTNDSGFLSSVAWGDVTGKPTFATVATSGSYNDLSNKPTIPTVNNGTLTIQKNGATVNTFTANSSNNVTANIPVPTLATTNTDPGEGAALAADTFLGVYDIAPSAIDGSRITNGTVTTNKLASNAVTAAKVDFSTFGVAATVNGPSSTTSKGNGATWASTDMYSGSATLAAGTYLVVVTGSAVAFSAGGEQEWFNVTIDSTIVMTGSLAWFTGSVVGGNGVGIATIGTSGTHTVAYQLGAQGARTCTLYGGSKIQFVRIG